MVKIDSAAGSLPVRPRELPMAGQRRERSDAAANRERILCAARTLLAEQGSDALTMQAVATAAGVGKGTVFHRFGDRDGLTQALIDDYMRDSPGPRRSARRAPRSVRRRARSNPGRPPRAGARGREPRETPASPRIRHPGDPHRSARARDRPHPRRSNRRWAHPQRDRSTGPTPDAQRARRQHGHSASLRTSAPARAHAHG